MRTPLLLATVPLAILIGACADSRQDDLPAPDAADLVIGTGFDATPPIASDVEVHRSEPPGTAEPRPAPTPPVQPRSARRTPLPATPEPAEHAGGQAPHGVHAEPEPDAVAVATAAEAGAAEALPAGPVARSGGKPHIASVEGPIRDPGARGGIVIIRGGPGSLDDDCAIHPRTPPMTAEPPIVTAMPDLDRGALINDRSPPGGSLSGDRPATGHTGELHPSGGRTGITGRPMAGGRTTVTGGRPGFRGRYR